MRIFSHHYLERKLCIVVLYTVLNAAMCLKWFWLIGNMFILHLSGKPSFHQQ